MTEQNEIQNTSISSEEEDSDEIEEELKDQPLDTEVLA
jgi:hypothetical protein